MSVVLDRFLKYVSKDTTSSMHSESYPSTPSQLEFAQALAKELGEIGLSSVKLDAYGYVTATLPANRAGVPVLGLLAHIDTSSEMRGSDIRPRIVEYQGGDIPLDKKGQIVLSEEMFPQLRDYTGCHLIVTDGSTLLGADDKAGVAEIVTAAQYLLMHPELPHGEIRLAFTPDEEVGQGTRYFNVEQFGAEFAYTVDGGPLGSIEFENFNAADADITINGINIHPGSAKNKMKNSTQIAMELNALLPSGERPEYTEGYEGFFHLASIHGDVSKTRMHYIIRDHSMQKFNDKKKCLEKIAQYLNDKYGRDTVLMTITDSYYNMLDKIAGHMKLIDLVKASFTDCGVVPRVAPIRGGTDGARLSYCGLPCPNLSTGGENFHGKFEFISVEALETMVDVLICLVGKFCG
ncbi:peptidase T [uncultured Oscillibacter sp.]|uniref:peptidase T n=1 Tax=uncultured Oscillibacter sp. TaxID=876091 RepID=UPI0025EFF687|nr:peptidase T [uncultured Oscillibacter sp.]